MIIICEECGKKYQTVGTLKKDKVKFNCRSCNQLITIVKPGVSFDAKDEAIGATVQLEPDHDISLEEDSSHNFDTDSSLIEKQTDLDSEATEEDNEIENVELTESSKVPISLSVKVITVMLLVSLIPLVLFWGISYKQTGNQIRNDSERIMAQTALGLGDQVNEWIDKNILVLKAAAKFKDIIAMTQEQQEPLLKAIQQEYPWMYLVFTVGLDGMNVARNDDKPLKDYSDRQYYKDIFNGKSLTWQTLIGKTSKKPALVLAVPIVSEEMGLVGVMAAAMNIDEISKRVANWKKGQTGFAFLVDEKRKVVAHQIKAFVLEQKKLNTHPLIAYYDQNKSDATIQFKGEDGNTNMGHVRGIKYGWALAIQQESQEIFTSLQKVQRLAWFLLGITVLVVTLIAWILARAIVIPIKKLTSAAERMSLGDLNVDIDIKSKDEVGLLAQAINRMQTSLRMAVERLRSRY